MDTNQSAVDVSICYIWVSDKFVFSDPHIIVLSTFLIFSTKNDYLKLPWPLTFILWEEHIIQLTSFEIKWVIFVFTTFFSLIMEMKTSFSGWKWMDNLCQVWSISSSKGTSLSVCSMSSLFYCFCDKVVLNNMWKKRDWIEQPKFEARLFWSLPSWWDHLMHHSFVSGVLKNWGLTAKWSHQDGCHKISWLQKWNNRSSIQSFFRSVHIRDLSIKQCQPK